MADISSLLVPSDLSGGSMSSAEAKKLRSYLYRLTEQLRYVLSNLDDENMSAAYSADLADRSVRLTALTETQKSDTEALQSKLVSTASSIARDCRRIIDEENTALRAAVRQENTAAGESLKAGLESLVHSQTGQTERTLNRAAAGQSRQLDRLAEAVDALQAGGEAWFCLTEDGLELGRYENGVRGAYSLRVAGDRIEFAHQGVPVACICDQRLYAAAAELAGGISIGGSDGFFDLIPAAGGFGIQWRADA